LKSVEEMKLDKAEKNDNHLWRGSGAKSTKKIKDIRNYLVDTYINSETSEVKEVYSFLTRILGLVSFYCETAAVIPKKEYQYEQTRKVYENIPKFPSVKTHDPIKIELSEYQLYHYARLRAREIEKELMSVRNRTQDDNIKKSQLFKVFSRQTSTFVFPPTIQRPRLEPIKYTKETEEETKKSKEETKKSKEETKEETKNQM
jgi:hypothetical protein